MPEMIFLFAALFGFGDDRRNWQLGLDDCRPACAQVLEPVEIYDQALKLRWALRTAPAPCSSFTCPRCGKTSANENDAREGYCGSCRAWTRP